MFMLAAFCTDCCRRSSANFCICSSVITLSAWVVVVMVVVAMCKGDVGSSVAKCIQKTVLDPSPDYYASVIKPICSQENARRKQHALCGCGSSAWRGIEIRCRSVTQKLRKNNNNNKLAQIATIITHNCMVLVERSWPGCTVPNCTGELAWLPIDP